MRRRLAIFGAAVILAVVAVIPVTVSAAGPAGSVTRQVPSGGTTSIHATSAGADELAQPELRPRVESEDGAGVINRPRPGFKNGRDVRG